MPLRQTYATQLNDPLLASNTINTFTGPQNLIRATGNGAYVAQPTIIPVNYLKPGTFIRVHAWGTYSSLTSATLSFGTYIGPTLTVATLAVSAAQTAGTTPALWPWDLWTETIVRSTVVPSAVVTHTHGSLDFGTSLTAVTRVPVPGVAMTTVNLDNTVALELGVGCTYGASSASNIVVLHGLTIEELTQI
jgi:hypothetical protein